MSPSGKSLFASLLLHGSVVLAAAVALSHRPGTATKDDAGGGPAIACLIVDTTSDGADAEPSGGPGIAMPPEPAPEPPSPGACSPSLALADIPAATPVDPITTAASPSVRSITVPATIAKRNSRKASRTSPSIRKEGALHAAGTAGENGGGNTAYSPARYARCPSPLFPDGARRAGISGTVLLYVEVDPNGRPVSVAVRRSSGHEALDSAAVRAVRNWRFEPARVGGRPVDARLEVPVRFALS